MNAEQLLALYDRVAEAPDAITRLRRFVLDLAMRGELVEQDPEDEPAAELLKRISAKKTQLVNAGAIKLRKVRSRARKNSLKFVPPGGWELTNLGAVALKITDGTHKTPTYVDKGVPFVSVKDFSAGFLDLSDTRFIPQSEHKVLYKRCDPRRGDILLGRIGTLGKAVLVDTDEEFSLFVSVGLVRFDEENIYSPYLRMVLNSPLVEKEFDKIKVGGGTHTNKLNLGDLHTVALPLPPLAEQHRIVAKVDELVALCDQLENARNARENTRDRLTKASYARLGAPGTDAATFRSYALFAVNALPALTARADQVKQLRQTILNLAVRGRLVEQDPADEPASELLKRLAVETAARQERRQTQNNNIPNTAEWSGKEDISLGWTWTRLGDVAIAMRYGTSVKCDYEKQGVPVLRIPNVSGGHVLLDDIKFGLLSPSAVTDLSLLAGDLLFIRSNGSLEIVGRTAVVPPEAVGMSFAGYLVRMRTNPSVINPDYVWLATNSSEVRDQIERPIRSTVGLKNINLTEFRALKFRLPPLAEQHRIVAKVDELMALCDQLENAITQADTSCRCLLDALLQTVVAPVAAHEGGVKVGAVASV